MAMGVLGWGLHWGWSNPNKSVILCGSVAGGAGDAAENGGKGGIGELRRQQGAEAQTEQGAQARRGDAVGRCRGAMPWDGAALRSAGVGWNVSARAAVASVPGDVILSFGIPLHVIFPCLPLRCRGPL